MNESPVSSVSSVSPATAVGILARREIIRFLRQPARIVAGVGTPLMMLAFLGSGVGESFRPAGLEGSYASFILPGSMMLVLVFTVIFAAIALIDARRDGWLQAVLVAPVPRWAVAAGPGLGATAIGAGQAALLLPAAWILGDGPGLLATLLTLAILLCTGLAVSGLGLAFAWRCRTSAEYHAVMNTVLMPMWLLSGAFFPADAAAPWLGVLMRLNPLTWCTSGLRGALAGDLTAGAIGLAVAAGSAVAASLLAARAAARSGGR
jgi:ABC-2 type transport system permease protein